MAHVNKVSRSIETSDGGRCVDLFVRPDETFGFEEYRRDHEDPSGWFAVGHYSQLKFESQDAALHEAKTVVAWLKSVIDEQALEP